MHKKTINLKWHKFIIISINSTNRQQNKIFLCLLSCNSTNSSFEAQSRLTEIVAESTSLFYKKTEISLGLESNSTGLRYTCLTSYY